MGAHQVNEFLSRFIDSRAPVLFVVGSLVLGLFSNAVYGLVLVLFGDSPWTLIGIVVAAAVILPLLYLSFRALVRAFRRPQTTTIAEDLRVLPHPALVLLVSANKNAPERDMIVHHRQRATLRHCWLIVTPAVRALGRHEDLRYELHSHNVEAHLLDLEDARQAQGSYAQVRRAVREARALLGSEVAVIVDITGGTKPMTAGAVLACRETGAAMEYAVHIQSRGSGGPVQGVPSAPILITFADGEEGL
ncbi:MAG: hypothetical protein WCI67_04460 [Chloroflexales bacterium]